ncbi:MAG: hypothetical protein DRI88_05860 [Bacteroidetes bacterium]|nr:MAG: hypothetical protein DRI88_05860 [Bacteroidota bacterium]RLD83601.1 MAG: hypothetical protein DRJ02_12705 [Bacteroidota bacterium]
MSKETNQKKDTKTKLLPALPEYNVQGKRVGNKRVHSSFRKGLLPKRQALLLLNVNIPEFTHAQARRFGNPAHISGASNYVNI